MTDAALETDRYYWLIFDLFEDWPICEFVLYNDKRCPIISATDMANIWLQTVVSVSKNDIGSL